MSDVFLGICFLFCCFVDYYLLRCFHIARHLAAKTGTNSVVFLVIGRLHMDGRYLEVVFNRGFFLMIAIFIRER
jgi:hypothetical protein